MEYATIPGTKLEASLICLGTGSYGSAISRDDSFKLLDTFFEAGGNFLDSAHIYAAWVPNGGGASERTIGAWMKTRGVRNKIIVGTKGAHPHLDSMHIPRMSRAEIAQDIQESQERLETDRIELYWLHRDAPAIPVGEILGMVNEHIAAGRIGAIGCSNWTPERQVEASDFAKRNNITGFCASQIGFSFAKANPETAFAGMLFMDDATLRFHRETGTPLVAYSSQANGFFSGKYTRSMPREKGVLKAYGCEENFARLDRAWSFAEDTRRWSGNQVALSYVLSQSFPAYAIVGPRSVEQVADSCRAAELRLTPEEAAQLTG